MTVAEVPSAAADGVEPPFSRDPPQLVGATVVERDAGAGDEIVDGLRDEDFVRLGDGGHACSDVDGDSGNLAVGDLALAGVDAGADRDVIRSICR